MMWSKRKSSSEKGCHNHFTISGSNLDIQKKPKQSSNGISHLAAYFQLFSYLFIVPFKVTFCMKESEVKVVCNSRGKIPNGICFTFQCVSLLFIMYAMSDAMRYMLSPNVDAWAILTFVSHIFEMILEMVVFSIFWFQRGNLERWLNIMEHKTYLYQEKEESPQNRIQIFWKNPKLLVLVSYISMIIAGVLSNYRRNVVWSASYAILDQIQPSSTKYISNATEFNQFLFVEMENRNGNGYVYGIFVLIVFFQRITSVCEIFVFCAAISLYKFVVNPFYLQTRNVKVPQMLIECFMKLRKNFDEFNAIFTKAFLIHYIVTLLYYIRTSAILTKMPFGPDKLYILIYVGVHGVTYCSACEAYKTIKTAVKCWISNVKMESEVSHIDLTRMNLLSMEIENDPLGVSCHFFVISYGLMGSFLALMATYAIFAVQMQVNSSN